MFHSDFALCLGYRIGEFPGCQGGFEGSLQQHSLWLCSPVLWVKLQEAVIWNRFNVSARTR